jgi:hypothetical protein
MSRGEISMKTVLGIIALVALAAFTLAPEALAQAACKCVSAPQDGKNFSTAPFSSARYKNCVRDWGQACAKK